MNRRRFLITSAAAAVTLKSYAKVPAQAAPGAHLARLALHTDKAGFTIPGNFAGLSYETQQLSESSVVSPANRELVVSFAPSHRKGCFFFTEFCELVHDHQSQMI